MERIEIPHFTEVVMDYMSDEEYAVFQWYLALNQETGGLRVIYYYRPNPSEIWLLTVYSKSRKQDLSANDKKTLNEIIRGINK